MTAFPGEGKEVGVVKARRPVPAAEPGVHGVPGAPPVPPPPTRWDRARPIVVPVLVAVLAKVAVVLLAYILLKEPDDFWHRMAWSWDGTHYINAARDGFEFRFDGDGESVAFAAFYPLLIRLFGGSATAALAVNNVASVLAVAVVAWHWGPRPAMAFALFPSWLVYGSVAYSEGLFVLFAALALAGIERGRQALGGLAAAAAALTRYVGGPALLLAAMPCRQLVAFVLAVTISIGRFLRLRRVARFLRLGWIVSILRLHRLGAAMSRWVVGLTAPPADPWRDWRAPHRWLAFALISVAGLAIFGYLWYATGAFFGYAEAQKPWGATLAWPWQHFDFLLNGWFTLQGGAIQSGNLSPLDFVVRDILFALPVIGGLVLLFRARDRVPSRVYSLVMFLVAICTVGIPGVSLPRMLVAAFPAIAILGTRLRDPWMWSAYAVAGVAVGADGLAHHLFRFWS